MCTVLGEPPIAAHLQSMLSDYQITPKVADFADIPKDGHDFFVHHGLASIQQHTGFEIEVIIIDDHSDRRLLIDLDL